MTCIHCRQVSCRAELARPPRPTLVVSLSAELTMKIIFLSDFCSLQTSIESRTAKNPSAGSRRDAHSFASWRSSKESDDKAWNATRFYGKSPWDECSTFSRGKTSERRKKLYEKKRISRDDVHSVLYVVIAMERRRLLHEIKIHFHPLASCELHSNFNANSHLISAGVSGHRSTSSAILRAQAAARRLFPRHCVAVVRSCCVHRQYGDLRCGRSR